MFGPIDTSYQLLNHSAGTPQPMESSYRPPVSHAGSPGPRAISSSKVPGGPSSDDISAAFGGCRIGAGQSTSGFSAPRSLYIATRARIYTLRSREIGKAPCRAMVLQSWYNVVVAILLKKKKNN